MIARTQQTKRIEDDTEEPEPVHTDEPDTCRHGGCNKWAHGEQRGTRDIPNE